MTKLTIESRYAATRAVTISCAMTLFPFFDIPVFWPILLVYFIVLFVITMRRQIGHMRKYKSVTSLPPVVLKLMEWGKLGTYHSISGAKHSTEEVVKAIHWEPL